MQKLLEEAKRLGVSVYFHDLKKNGYSIIELKTVFVNQKLNEDQIKKVLLHELAHFKFHAEYLALYNTFINHSKMENEAKNFMVNSIIAENDGHYNYTQLIEEFDIGMGYDVLFGQ